MKPIKLVIKSTLDRAGFDATTQSVEQLKAATDGQAVAFDKLGNVSGAVSSAISGDLAGVGNSVFNLTKSLKNVGGVLGGLAQAAGPLALVGTVAMGAYKAIQGLGEKIRKAREEAEAARIAKQAEELRELAGVYGELTAQVERYGKAQNIAASNAINLQGAISGLQQSQLERQMNEELRRTPADKQDEVRKRYSRYAEDLKDAQALKAIELEMAKNEAEIARQEKLAGEATRFANEQLDAKNRLISDTARHIAGKEGFSGTQADALNQAAEDSAVREAVAAEKAARANAENARNELAKLRAAQDVLKVKAAEVKQNNANARAAREIEDRAELEKKHEEALAEAIKKKAELADKVAKAEEEFKKAQEAEGIRQQNKALQEGLQLLNQQIAAAKELLGVANQANGKGRLENLADAEKKAAQEAKEAEKQRKRDEKRMAALGNRAGGLGGTLAKDVFGNYYVRSRNGEDITGRLSKKDQEMLRRMNEINRAEQAVQNAQANQNAIQGQIAAGQAALANNPVQAAEQAVEAAKAEAKAAQEALEKIENKFAADITALSESFADYRSDLEAVVRDVTAPATGAIAHLDKGLQDLNTNLTRLLTAQ